MPENAKEQIKRIDTLDKKEDKHLSVVAGKEKELTETYITKTEELLNKTDELDNADPEKQKVKDDLTGLLKEIDEKTLAEKEQEFEEQIDQFIDKTEERVDVQKRLIGLGGNFWEEFGANDSFEKVYEKLIKDGKEINPDQLNLLENYAEGSQEIGLKYQETMMYFDEDGETPTTETNEAMESYFGERTVEKIITGAISNPDELVKKLEELTDLATEEKQKCEEFRMSLIDVSSKSGEAPKFNSMLFKLTQDKGALLDVYATLKGRANLTNSQIRETLSAVANNGEFNKDWGGVDEFKKFVVEACIRGGLDKNALEKMGKEERARKIFEEQEKELNKLLEEQNNKADRIEKEIEDLKADVRKSNGEEAGRIHVYFDNFEDDTESKESTEIDQATNKEISKSKIFNFKMLAQMEADLEEAQFGVLETSMKKEENEAMYAIALFRADNDARVEETFDDFDRSKFEFATPELISKTGQFTSIERMKIEKGVKETELRNAKELCENKDALEKELKYRQALEGGRQLDEETKSFAEAKKFEDLRRVSTERSEIKKLIEREEKEVTDAIAKYGSIEFVPPNEKPALFSKAKTLVELLGTSLNCMNKCVELENELQAVSPENITKETIGQRIKEDYEKQSKLLFDTSKFLTGKGIEFPPPNETSPDLAMFVFNNLQDVVDSMVKNPMERYGKASEQVSYRLNSQLANAEKFKGLVPNKHEILAEGVKELENMEFEFLTCQTLLRKSVSAMENSLNSEFFKQHPELLDEAKKMIGQVTKEITRILENQFSWKTLDEIRETKTKLQNAKDDMFWDVVKFAAVFAASVGAAILAAVAVGAFAGYLFGATRLAGAAQFIGNNLGMAAGSTFGSRTFMELTDVLPGSKWGDRVDWSPKALAIDFGKTFACAVLVTGAGTLIGEKLAINTVIRTGGEFTYAELSEFGLTRLSVFEKLFNPFGGAAKHEAATIEQSFARKAGGEFLQEIVEESRDEVVEAVDNQMGTKFQFLFSILSAAKGHDVNVDINTDVQTQMQNLGVEFNKNSKRLELAEGMSAINFATEFKSSLGEAGHAVETWINDDGSVGIRVKGTEATAVIHQKETKVGQNPPDKNDSFMGILNAELTAAPALGFLGAGKIEGFLRGLYRGARKAIGVETETVADGYASVENMPGLTTQEKHLLMELYPKGIENSHIEQMNTGDCYFLAALHGAKLKDVFPYIIAKNISEGSDPELGKCWIVKFADGHEVKVAEYMLRGEEVWDNELGKSVFKETVKGQKGDKILEVAFAIRRQKIQQKEGDPSLVQARMLGVEGGDLREGFEALLPPDIGKSFTHNMPNDLAFVYADPKAIEEDLNAFAANPDDTIMIVATPSDIETQYFLTRERYIQKEGKTESKKKKIYFMDPQMNFPTTHAYTVTAVDSENRKVTIANPHGTKEKETTITYEEFYRYFSGMKGVKLNRKKIEKRYGGKVRLMGDPSIKGNDNNGVLTDNVRYRYTEIKEPLEIGIVGGDKKIIVTYDKEKDTVKLRFEGEEESTSEVIVRGDAFILNTYLAGIKFDNTSEQTSTDGTDVRIDNIGEGRIVISKTGKHQVIINKKT